MLLTLGAAASDAADFRGDARVWLGAGVDTNPRRDFTTSNVFPPYDVFGALVATGNATLENDRFRLYGSYDFGGRKFFLYPGEDTVIQSAFLDGSVAVGKHFGLGVAGRARDRRGAAREYTDLLGEGYVEFVPDPHLSVKLRIGAHRFLYWNQFSASYWGPAGGGSVSYRFNKRHSVFLLGDYESHTHNANACLWLEGPIGEFSCQKDPPPGRRHDAVISFGLGYSFRGPFHLTTQYSYVDSASNSFGDTYRRHRLSLTFGARLPLDFTLLTSAAIQFAQYPDGLRLIAERPEAPDLLVREDDENANMVTVKLVHPLAKHFDIDFKFAVYFNKLGNDYTYLRMVGSLGFGWKL